MNGKGIKSQIISVSFGVYNTNEIKNLSVLEVENPQTFDPLGHPNSGGLCDNAFGIYLFIYFVINYILN
jgi:DNA-directed RNA polymerase beta' subunit